MRSEKGRILASQLNKKIIDSILATDSKAKIVNMGDFNDNPTDKSIKPILKTVANKSKINCANISSLHMHIYFQHDTMHTFMLPGDKLREAG